jgi:hypothetical protein
LEPDGDTPGYYQIRGAFDCGLSNLLEAIHPPEGRVTFHDQVCPFDVTQSFQLGKIPFESGETIDRDVFDFCCDSDNRDARLSRLVLSGCGPEGTPSGGNESACNKVAPSH